MFSNFETGYIPFSEMRDEKGKLIYDWPYSARCPNCHEETLQDSIVCSKCGHSMEQKQCPRCGVWMHHAYLDGKKQCSLYCDVKDKQEKESREYLAYRKDYRNVSTYPKDIQPLAKLFFDEYLVSYESTKEEFIQLLYRIKDVCK